MTTIAVKITSQAQANQLASIVHSNNATTIDQDFYWDGVRTVLEYTQKPFVVGNTALFLVNYVDIAGVTSSQYTSNCTKATLDSLSPEQYGTVNDLAQVFHKLG